MAMDSTGAVGRLEPDVLEKVLPLFSSRSLGAVQVGVRLAALESVDGIRDLGYTFVPVSDL